MAVSIPVVPKSMYICVGMGASVSPIPIPFQLHEHKDGKIGDNEIGKI